MTVQTFYLDGDETRLCVFSECGGHDYILYVNNVEESRSDCQYGSDVLALHYGLVAYRDLGGM